MKIIRILAAAAALLVVALAAGLGIAWILTAPEAPPAGSESAARLEPGPHGVGQVELEWVDDSRPTAENGDYSGSPARAFPVALWYPEGAGGAHPLAVYSHGFMSSRHGGAYLAEHLASHGYVVVAADYPLTHLEAPGGPSFLDVVHQPGDVSFVIDRALALDGPGRPFDGELDAERIGVFGLSLGGATSTLAAFHPEWRDPRVGAAISLAGPGDVFGPRYFDHADVPFLMIAGTLDALVDYASNAAPLPDRVRRGGLLTIAGGTHVGFAAVASGMMRLLGNPDAAVCRLAGSEPQPEPDEHPFVGLFGTPEQGLLEVATYPVPCGKPSDGAIAAGRQQMVTALAVRAFFESRFARSSDARAGHEAFLTRTLPAELPEVTYAPSRR